MTIMLLLNVEAGLSWQLLSSSPAHLSPGHEGNKLRDPYLKYC